MSDLIWKVWGSEEVMVNRPEYCGKILRYKRGFQSSLHSHKLKTETFHLLAGEVILEHGDPIQNAPLIPGTSFTLFPGDNHRVIAIKDSLIIETATQHFDEDTYRVPGEESRQCQPA